MTNDEYGRLIDFIGRRFDEVDAKLAEHDVRFEQIDARIEHKLDGEQAQREALGQELSTLKGHVAALQSRIEELERRIA